jgi:hypothetical protein
MPLYYSLFITIDSNSFESYYSLWLLFADFSKRALLWILNCTGSKLLLILKCWLMLFLLDTMGCAWEVSSLLNVCRVWICLLSIIDCLFGWSYIESPARELLLLLGLNWVSELWLKLTWESSCFLCLIDYSS